VEKRGLKYHRGRVGEALREEIETLVEGELADPRIGLVSVTAVHIADDGRSAQVWVNVEGDDEDADRKSSKAWKPPANTFGMNWSSVCI
jgi:ribosome-binding factor A